MTFFNASNKVQKQSAGSMAIAGFLCVGVASVPAHAATFNATYTAHMKCGNQGWILQADQEPGVSPTKAKLISQGHTLDGTLNSDDGTYIFESDAYEYQVNLQDNRTAKLRIVDKTGKPVDEQQCTYRSR